MLECEYFIITDLLNSGDNAHALGTSIHNQKLDELLSCNKTMDSNIQNLSITYPKLLEISQHLQIMSEKVRAKASESIN